MWSGLQTNFEKSLIAKTQALDSSFGYYLQKQWYNLFCLRGLSHDTRVTQSLHSILPCGALYKLDPLRNKGTLLRSVFEGMRSQTLGHDTQVTQLSHSILPCGALYKLDPLETKGLTLVGFSKGCVHKHFSVAVVEWSYAIKLKATHITILVYILFCPRRLGHDTQVTQLSHSILPCGALYKLDPLETKGLYLVRFSKGCVLKHWAMIPRLCNYHILFYPAVLYINWTLSKQRNSP